MSEPPVNSFNDNAAARPRECPAMSDRKSTPELTEMQAAFVVAYVANGGNGTQAAIEAGYSKDSARQQAYALTHNPRVLSAVQAEQRRSLARISNKALAVIEGFLDDKTAPAGVRLDAAKTTLDRAGLTAATAEDDFAKLSKPLQSMTTEELEAYIAHGRAAQQASDTD